MASSDMLCSSSRSQNATSLPFSKATVLSSGSAPFASLPGIDVRIEVEQHVVGIVEDRRLERFERARVVGALRDGIGPELRARMPDVELERARLREPQQRRQVVAQQVVVLLVLAAREHGDRSRRNRGPLLLPVLLEEALAADAVGHADHRQRPIGEVRQHVGRDLREVGEQVALGERRQALRRIGRPVDAIEVRETDAVRADRQRERRLRARELRDDVVDRAAGECRRRGGRLRRAAPTLDRRRRAGAGTPARAGDRRRSSSGSSLRRRSPARPRSSAVELRRLGERAASCVAAARSRPLTCASVRSSKPEPTCDA